MAFQIDPNIPLQAQRTTFDPAAILMQAQTNAANLEKHRFEMQKLREDYDLAKEKRKQEKAMQMGIASDLAGIQSGSPAQYAPMQFQQQPQQPKAYTGDLMGGDFQLGGNNDPTNGSYQLGGGEVTQEAVAGREPLPIDFLKSALKHSMLNRDYDNALKFQKAIQESEKQGVEWGTNPTKGINPTTMEPDSYITNRLGEVKWLGSGVYEAPKDVKTSLVKTSKGFEVVREGELPKGTPVEPQTQPRQPRLQQVTNENGTYLLDIDTGETKPVIVGGKQLKPTTPQKEPSVEEGKSAGYAFRMGEATKIISGFEKDKKGLPSFATSIASSVPFVGSYLEREVQNTNQQLYKNAAMAWLRAKLRDESGAVIGKGEASDEYQTYFPVMGDTAETIKQKALLRDVAEREMLLKAGKASNKLDAARVKKDKEEYLFERAKAVKSGNKKLVETLDAKANEMGML